MRPMSRLTHPLAVAVLLGLGLTAQAAEQDPRHRFKWRDEPRAICTSGLHSAGSGASGLRHRQCPGACWCATWSGRRLPRNSLLRRPKKEKAEADKKAAAEQASRDAQMLAAYPNEDELKKAHGRRWPWSNRTSTPRQPACAAGKRVFRTCWPTPPRSSATTSPCRHRAEPDRHAEGGIVEQKRILEKRRQSDWKCSVSSSRSWRITAKSRRGRTNCAPGAPVACRPGCAAAAPGAPWPQNGSWRLGSSASVTAVGRLDAQQRGIAVGIEAQHQHRRGVGGAHQPQPSGQSARTPSMVVTRAPSRARGSAR